MNRREAAKELAALDAVCAENARLLGEPQKVFPRRIAGKVRIQLKEDGEWVPNAYVEYHSMRSAMWAAGVSGRRAAHVAELVARGQTVERAVAIAAAEIRE